MSIIHDALKKAGDGKTVRATPPSAPQVSIRRDRGRTAWGPIFALGLIVAVGAPLARSYFMQAANSPADAPNSAAALKPSAPGAQGQFGIEEIPLPSVPPGVFNVSGVVVGADDSYGIINGRIVRAGQEISGAVVRSITGKKVTLDYAGKTVVLPISDPNSL